MTTQSPETNLLSVDVLHYVCVPENRLEDAFLLLSPGKGGRLPQTCLPDNPERTLELLTQVLGYNPTADEWATFSYKWFREFNPDQVLFVPMPPPTSLTPIPLPDTLGFLIGSLCCLALVALWKWCDELSDGNIG